MQRFGTWLIGLALSLILVPAPSIACGCGMAIDVTPGRPDFRLASGDTEAYLALHNGQETLTFVRDFAKSHNQGKLLLVPVPAAPKAASIQITDTTPTLRGVGVLDEATSRIDGIGQALEETQLYPAILALLRPPTLGIAEPMVGSTPLGDLKSAAAPAVTVYQHLEKNGLVAELVSAASANDLADYFKQKNLPLTPKQLPIFDRYMGPNESFAAIWADPNVANTTPAVPTPSPVPLPVTPDEQIAPIAEPVTATQTSTTQIQSGFVITFPASELYYPLLPSSAFGDTQIAETLHVANFVSPKLFGAIKPATTVTYLRDQEPATDTATADFYGNGPARYTTVQISAASKQYSQDLTLPIGAPTRINLADWLSLGSAPISVAMFVIFLFGLVVVSMVASGLSGMVTIERDQGAAGFWRTARLGLWNLLSLVGLTIATLALVRPWMSGNGDAVTKRPRTWAQIIAFLILFSIIFVVIIAIAQLGADLLFHV